VTGRFEFTARRTMPVERRRRHSPIPPPIRCRSQLINRTSCHRKHQCDDGITPSRIPNGSGGEQRGNSIAISATLLMKRAYFNNEVSILPDSASCHRMSTVFFLSVVSMISRFFQLSLTLLLVSGLLVPPAMGMVLSCCCQSADRESCCDTAPEHVAELPPSDGVGLSCCAGPGNDECQVESHVRSATEDVICLQACCQFCADCRPRSRHEERIVVAPVELVPHHDGDARVDVETLYPTRAGKAFDGSPPVAPAAPLRVLYDVWLI
jgi:hypothetical protein